MAGSQKKTNRFILVTTIVITYLIVKVIYKFTGFHYDFSDGIINFRFLIDLALWGLVYLTVNFFLRKLFSKSTE